MRTITSSLIYRLGRGAEAGLSFARLCSQLLSRDAVKNSWHFQASSDSSGDFYGLDGIGTRFPHPSGGVVGFQFKFLASPLGKSRSQVRDSILSALKVLSQSKITLYVLWTPEDLQRHDLEWLYGIVKDPSIPFQVLHWGKTRLDELLLENRDIGIQYYPEMQDTETLIGSLNNLISAEPHNAGFIDPKDFLSRLRREVSILEDNGTDGTVGLLKNQIKEFCIMSELYFTQKTAEDLKGGSFLYSCSSLIDNGVAEYFSDAGWLLLLRGMRQAKRESGGEFMRVFFIDRRTLSGAELESLAQIVDAHLKSGVSVGFADDRMITGDARIKRNMALLGSKALISATDQIQWDLDFTRQPSDLTTSRDKYLFFVDSAFLIVRPDQRASALSALKYNFEVQDANSENREEH
jgi:hypothetical protein